jgi:hypothetical protein
MQGSARADRPEQTRPVRNFYMVNTHSAEIAILARCMEKIVTIHLVGGIDSAGMAAVMDTVGHAQSFTEAMIAYVREHVAVDLSALFQIANQQEDNRRSASISPGSERVAQDQSRRVGLPDLSRARQLALFGERDA